MPELSVSSLLVAVTVANYLSDRNTTNVATALVPPTNKSLLPHASKVRFLAPSVTFSFLGDRL